MPSFGRLAIHQSEAASLVRKDFHLTWPTAETPTHLIAMRIDKDLDEAIKIAVRETINLLVREKKLVREDAYMLASTAVDHHVTQVVAGTKAIHAMIPRSPFKPK